MSSVMNTDTPAHDDPLMIGGTAYRSRLLVGTGKYRDLEETRRAVEASGAEIITVAIRRTNIGQDPNEPSLLEVLPAASPPRSPCPRSASPEWGRRWYRP